MGRQTLFHKEEDYAAFERVMAEAHQRVPTRILSYCLMPHARAWPTFAAIHGGNGQEPSGMNRFLFSSWFTEEAADNLLTAFSLND